MSYQMVPIFRCELCGRTEYLDGRQLLPSFGFAYELPSRWFGSKFKYGACYCSDCRDAICEAKDRKRVERSQK